MSTSSSLGKESAFVYRPLAPGPADSQPRATLLAAPGYSTPKIEKADSFPKTARYEQLW
jgi:hypothetical protein